MIRWLRSLFRSARYRQRDVDAAILWPAIWHAADGDPMAFIFAASKHAAYDPCWSSHGDEWRGTPVDPGVWAARRQKGIA